MVRDLWLKFDRDWGWNLARLLAYACLQTLFAVLGLELIALALGLRIVEPLTDPNIVWSFAHLLPDHVTESAVESFERSLLHAPMVFLLLGLPVALWYGSRFFVVLESCLCVIFRRRQRSFLRQNRVALLMLLLFSALLPVMVFSVAVEPSLSPIPLRLRTTTSLLTTLSHDPVIATLGLLASLASNFLLFLLAYSAVTPGGVSLRSSWPGALLGAGLAQVYLFFFPYYVRNVLHPDHFGTIAGFVLMILVFFYAYSLFIVIGAELVAWREGLRAAPQDIASTLATPRVSAVEQPPAMPQRPAAGQLRIASQVPSVEQLPSPVSQGCGVELPPVAPLASEVEQPSVMPDWEYGAPMEEPILKWPSGVR